MQNFCSGAESLAPMPKTQALPVKRDTEEVMHENSPAARQGHPTCCVGASRANVKEGSKRRRPRGHVRRRPNVSTHYPHQKAWV